MAENTKIQWADHTFNPWMGCSKVAEGCRNCYAENLMDTRYGKVQWGQHGTRVRTVDSNWQKPVKWNRDAACLETFDCANGDHADCCPQSSRPRVFCASLADVFENRPLTEWATICDGYRISVRGEIQSQWRAGGHRGNWKKMRPKIDHGGYEVIQLRRDPVRGHRTLKVHRLIMEVFVGPCPDGQCVRHLNGNRSDNALWNLSYGTQSENLADRDAHGTDIAGSRNGRAKLCETDVRDIRKLLDDGCTQDAIAARYGVAQGTISKIALGKRWGSRESVRDVETIRPHTHGHVIDSRGRPLFIESDGKITHDPAGNAREFTPATITDLRADLFRLIDATPHLMWLILTKRPENVLEMWPASATTYTGIPESPIYESKYRPNVALITSVSTQADADRNIPLLLQCRDLCPVLGVSAEPLVEALDLDLGRCDAHDRTEVAATEEGLEFCGECAADGWSGELSHGHWLDGVAGQGIDWVIAGGESGPGARPCRIEWLRDIVEQCRESSVPVFVKQLGSKVAAFDDGGIEGNEMVDAAWLTLDPKGGDIDEFPEDLRVREFPAWERK